jgi:hypothetical protein
VLKWGPARLWIFFGEPGGLGGDRGRKERQRQRPGRFRRAKGFADLPSPIMTPRPLSPLTPGTTKEKLSRLLVAVGGALQIAFQELDDEFLFVAWKF